MERDKREKASHVVTKETGLYLLGGSSNRIMNQWRMCRCILHLFVASRLLVTGVMGFAPVIAPVPFGMHPPTAAQTQINPQTARTHSTSSTLATLTNHRHSSADWLYNIRSIPSSTILKEVRHPVLAVFAWSTIVTCIHRSLLRSATSATQILGSGLHMSGVAHSFLVSALGLLLVFRTNSAYQRFQEGRQIWQEILSVARNFSRMARLYRHEIGDTKLNTMMNLLASFPYLLRHHVRPGCLCESASDAAAIPLNWRLRLDERPVDLETRHEGDTLIKYSALKGDGHGGQRPQCWVDRRNLPWRLFDTSKALSQVSQSQNRPLWVCDRLGREIAKIPYGPNFSSRERLTMLQHVEKLTNAVGQCERIHQTAVPLNYARHSLRSLTIWLFTLPFCLVKEMGLLTPIATAVSAWTLFGIYQIGYSIEDPFQGSLRLSILCDSIRRDVLAEYETGPREPQFDEPGYEESSRQRSNQSVSRQFVQSVFSNGTVVDSTVQQDLGRLMNPPNLMVEGSDSLRASFRSINVKSLP